MVVYNVHIISICAYIMQDSVRLENNMEELVCERGGCHILCMVIISSVVCFDLN